MWSAQVQIVTAEAKRVIKTWDMSTYQCLQTIVVNELTLLRCFVSIPLHNRLLVARRSTRRPHRRGQIESGRPLLSGAKAPSSPTHAAQMMRQA